MHKIAIEEHFLLRELDDYFHTLVKGVSNESFVKVPRNFGTWIRLVSQTWISKEGPTWNWTVETATHALRIICSGVFDAYPKAMMILGHMGELLPFSMERFDQGWQFYAGHKAKHPITFYMRNNLFITTSGNVSPVSLTGAIMSLGADRILFATDYPFDLGPAFRQNLESGILSAADLDKVYGGNAKRVFKLGDPA